MINLANFVHSTFMNLMRMRSFSFSITHLHVASEFKCLFWYVERGAADIQYFFLRKPLITTLYDVYLSGSRMEY